MSLAWMLALPAAHAAVTYTLHLITDEARLRAGGIQEFPILLREFVPNGSPGFQGFFGEYPLRRLDSPVQSVQNTPLDLNPAGSGYDIEVLPYVPGSPEKGFHFTLRGEPNVWQTDNNTPISGVSEWQFGTLRIDLGPPVILDDGVSGSPDGIRVLDIEFGNLAGGGSGVYQPNLNEPSSGGGFAITAASIRIDLDFEQMDNELTVADGATVIIDSPATNVGIYRAENGGELLLAADVVNFGTIEALAGSTVSNQGFAIRQIDNKGTVVTWDDRLSGGVFRVVDGVLDLAPDGFALSDLAGVLEIAGTQAWTDFFDDAASAPGQFSTDGSTLTILGNGRLRLDQGATLDAFIISFFNGGCLEVFGGSEVSTMFGINGSSGTFKGDGSVVGNLDVGTVSVGGESAQAGHLSVSEYLSFQVQSELQIDLINDSTFDTVFVGTRLFIEDNDANDVDDARLRLNLADGYVPAVGQQFVIATAGEINGTFDIVNDNSPYVDFVSITDTNAGTLTVEAVLPNTGLTTFRTTYGMAYDGGDDLSDFSSNGIANIFYYAFGLGDPSLVTVDSARLPRISLSPSNQVTVAYVRPSGDNTGLSDTLVTWEVLGDQDLVSVDALGSYHTAVTETVSAVGTDHELVELEFPPPFWTPFRCYAIDVRRTSGP